MNKFRYAAIVLLWLASTSFAWTNTPARSRRFLSLTYQKNTDVPCRNGLPSLLVHKVVDAEFEKVDESKADTSINSKKDVPFRSKSLLEISTEADPEWQDVPVPFVRGNDYINTKLAFLVELDGTKYGIAIPYEHAVALTVEESDGTVSYISPDLEESTELLEVMAGQLQEHIGEDLKLKRTPKVLTISGPLEEYCGDWQEDILPEPFSKKELLSSDDDDDMDIKSFYEFMKAELGEEEFRKTLDESSESSDDIDAEFASLFDIPGFGDSTFGNDENQSLLDSTFTDIDKQIAEMESALGGKLMSDGVALKLISYKLSNGNTYSMSKLLKPFAIVGRLVSEGEDGSQFELLDAEEENIIIPKLEKVCKEDLQKFGLTMMH